MDRQDPSQLVRAHLSAIAAIVRERPVAVAQLRAETESLLAYLSSAEGRTDENCRAVDSALMSDNELWTVIDEVEVSDARLAGVLRDMAGALHDTVSAPEIAANFESTPEQLLSRLRMGKMA